MRFPRIIMILITAFFIPLNTQAADMTPGRLVRPGDALLRDRLAAAHFVRGKPIDVMALNPPEESATATDYLNTGNALAWTGRYVKASEAFQQAILKSTPGDETNRQAVLRFLDMSPYNPGFDLPQLQNDDQTTLNPELALRLSGYLADKGDREGALAILEKAKFNTPEDGIVSGILKAGHLAAQDRWEDSARLIGKIRGTEPTTLVDLLYLTKGYHFLENKLPDRARSSFQAIPPSSPYASEALLGKAWSHISRDDLQEATLVLEELVNQHRYSPATGDGVIDLAIAYRELGLYDRAGTVLEAHLKRLEEVRNWLLELRQTDLLTGKDVISLLEKAVDGTAEDRELLMRTPEFTRQWVMDIASDPYVVHTTDLLKGLHLQWKKAEESLVRLKEEREMVRREIEWVSLDISRTRSIQARLEQIRNELRSIKDNMSSILQDLSLSSFSSKRATTLIKRTVELKLRLALMENSVSKAEGFTTLISRLSESVTASEEESQLNKIRKQAYDGLVSSRLTLRSLKHGLSALEGQLWLEVKGGAIQLERKTSLRVTSGRTRAGQASAEASKALRLFSQRLNALEDLDNLILAAKENLTTGIPAKLKSLEKKIDENRASRLLALASHQAQMIREAEAMVLYTSADIEISRMENTVRTLQEAIQ